MESNGFSEKFRVKPGQAITLARLATDNTDTFKNADDARPQTQAYTDRLRELQYLLFAQGKHGLLICLQAMDSGGKDGTIRHVLGVMNPQGCRVQGFKVPTPQEAAHDFLWRIHKAVPGRGEVVIFNRSHYEDVLVTRVHQLVPKSVWLPRYDAINHFEDYLVENGIHVLKFFLHISKEEQLKRFKKRFENPERHWKISESDYTDRVHWDAYQQAYEDALNRCSTEQAPWFVIPADKKWFRDLAVAEIVVEFLSSLDMHTPAPTVDIEAIKKKYHEELLKEKNGM